MIARRIRAALLSVMVLLSAQLSAAVYLEWSAPEYDEGGNPIPEGDLEYVVYWSLDELTFSLFQPEGETFITRDTRMVIPDAAIRSDCIYLTVAARSISSGLEGQRGSTAHYCKSDYADVGEVEGDDEGNAGGGIGDGGDGISEPASAPEAVTNIQIFVGG